MTTEPIWWLIAFAIWLAALAGLRLVAPGRMRENLEAYLYLLPAGAVLLAFWFLPAACSIAVSFTNWTGASRINSVQWTGIENYRRALSDDQFQQVLYNTLNYVLYSVPLTIVAALAIASLLNSQIFGRQVFRTIYFLPYVTTWVAVSIVFKYVFNEQFGLANHLLHSSRLPMFGWLNEPRGIIEMLLQDGAGIKLGGPLHPLLAGPSLAMFSVILTSVWRDVGYFMVIFLAGLQNIDKTFYEAAEIDGATAWQRFRHVTWPLLSPTTFFILVVSLIAAFKVFVPMYIMTPGGTPGGTTETLVSYLFKVGFTGYRELGYASAVAYILFLIILVITVAQNTIIGRKVHYA
ncbi:MAG: carbohydrate ABC transporter permease [Candidatus Sumerlaeaceae bacterium]